MTSFKVGVFLPSFTEEAPSVEEEFPRLDILLSGEYFSAVDKLISAVEAVREFS